MKRATQVASGTMDSSTRQQNVNIVYNFFETLYNLRITPEIVSLQLNPGNKYNITYFKRGDKYL